MTERLVEGTIVLERSGAAAKVMGAVLQFFREPDRPETEITGDVLRFTYRVDDTGTGSEDVAAASLRRMRDGLESGLLRAGVQGRIRVEIEG